MPEIKNSGIGHRGFGKRLGNLGYEKKSALGESRKRLASFSRGRGGRTRQRTSVREDVWWGGRGTESERGEGGSETSYSWKRGKGTITCAARRGKLVFKSSSGRGDQQAVGEGLRRSSL